MKLQKEYEGLKSKIENLDREKVLIYKENLRASKEYNDFNARFAWDVLRAVVLSSTISQWYDQYDCNDKHITTLAVKACKDTGIL